MRLFSDFFKNFLIKQLLTLLFPVTDKPLD